MNEYEVFITKHLSSLDDALFADFKRVRDISSSCANLLGYFNDMNAETIELLQQEEFARIKERIISRTNGS